MQYGAYGHGGQSETHEAHQFVCVFRWMRQLPHSSASTRLIVNKVKTECAPCADRGLPEPESLFIIFCCCCSGCHPISPVEGELRAFRWVGWLFFQAEWTAMVKVRLCSSNNNTAHHSFGLLVMVFAWLAVCALCLNHCIRRTESQAKEPTQWRHGIEGARKRQG